MGEFQVNVIYEFKSRSNLNFKILARNYTYMTRNVVRSNYNERNLTHFSLTGHRNIISFEMHEVKNMVK